MKLINGAYGDRMFPLSNDTLETWFLMLKDLNANATIKAVKEYIRTNTYPPTINALYDSVTKLQGDGFNIREEFQRCTGQYPTDSRFPSQKYLPIAFEYYKKFFKSNMSAEQKRRTADVLYQRIGMIVRIYESTPEKKPQPYHLLMKELWIEYQQRKGEKNNATN